VLVPWLKRLVDSLSQRRFRFSPGPVHEGFIVGRVSQGQVYPWLRRFFIVNNIPPVLPPILFYTLLLLEGQTPEAWEPFKKQCPFENWRELDRKYFLVFSACAVVQAVSWPSVIAEVQVRSPISTCEIYGRQSGVWQGLLRALRFSPASILPTVIHTYLHLHVALTRRTKTRSLESSRKAMLYRKPMSIG
jgi:hypothetical protein